MAVSKRLRYEILRRDNHTCRYCGATAPDVTLHVDHVVPTTLGGSDDPANLVAACKDCNSGKSATPADAALIADVSQDALRWSQAMQRAFASRVTELHKVADYTDAFHTYWYGWTKGGRQIDLPDDWERSLTVWYGRGVPLEIVKDATSRAMHKAGLRGFDAEFRYMAGVVWGVIRDAQDAAQAAADPDPLSPVVPSAP